MVLEKEQETYQRELPNLLQHEGKFVLIRESRIAGFFGTYEDAIQAGYVAFGLNPFMVKQIRPTEQVHQFSRPIAPCHT
jgi:hypothetical protein